MFKNKVNLIRAYFTYFLLFTCVLSVSLVLYSIAQSIFEADSLPIAENNNTLHQSHAYLVDPFGELTVDTMPFDRFSSALSFKTPYNVNTDIYWVKIVLENKQSITQALTLHADNAMINKFNLYQLKESQYEQVFSLGNNAYQPTLITRTFLHYDFELSADEKRSFLLELQTLGPPNIPIKFYHPENFKQRTLMTQLLFGAFIGVLLIMAVYNLIVYLALKDKVYLLYIGYLLSSFIVVSSLSGFGFYLFTSDIQDHLNTNLVLFQYSLVIFLIYFTLYYLRYNKGIIYKVGHSLALLLIVMLFLSFGLEQTIQSYFFFALQPIIYLFAIIAVCFRLRRDFYWARFYFISWLPLLLGSAIQPLVLTGFLEYSFITRHAFLLAVLIGISFMAFALAERIRRNDQKRLSAIYYHTPYNIPRCLMLRTKMKSLIGNERPFTIVTIKPEQIDQIALYIDNKSRAELFERFYNALNLLLNDNVAILALNDKKEKISLIDNSLVIIMDVKKLPTSIHTLVSSIQKVITEHYNIAPLDIPLTALVGLAAFPEQGERSQLLLNRSIIALTKANNSLDKWAEFELVDVSKGEALLTLAGDLKSAIENKKIELYHQPQIDLKTLKVCGSECLLRWNHDTEGFIAPATIISIAEDIGLITELTLAIVEIALAQHQEIIDSGHGNHMVSINITAKDVSNHAFFDNLLTIIESTTIQPEKIILELTESTSILNNQQALENLQRLSDHGFSISVDDFGTGYSSLAYLTSIPLNELKIDRHFVEDISSSRKKRVICETTAIMAKGLGFEVVAEGINSNADEAKMKEIGCDIGQGYYYSTPLKIDEYIDWLKIQVKGQAKTTDAGDFIPANK